jgi:hypothetical protein
LYVEKRELHTADFETVLSRVVLRSGNVNHLRLVTLLIVDKHILKEEYVLFVGLELILFGL